VGHALRSGDLDQIRGEAVAAGDLERRESDDCGDPRPALSEGRRRDAGKGVRALERDLTTAVNSPTNFAGDAGSVTVASDAIPLLPPWGALLGLLLLPALGWPALARRGRPRATG
jgi:hypothetical protein